MSLSCPYLSTFQPSPPLRFWYLEPSRGFEGSKMLAQFICIFLHLFASTCIYFHLFASICILYLFAIICIYLHLFSTLCNYLHLFASICNYMKLFEKYLLHHMTMGSPLIKIKTIFEVRLSQSI